MTHILESVLNSAVCNIWLYVIFIGEGLSAALPLQGETQLIQQIQTYVFRMFQNWLRFAVTEGSPR